MFEADWYEKTFELFKRKPNSTEIFELIGSELDSALKSLKFEQVAEGSEDSSNSSGSYCGASFKKDQLLYHCRYKIIFMFFIKV